MMVQIGMAMLMIWLLNVGFIVYEIFKHTPNWKDEDVDSDELLQNFMTNTPMERIQMIQQIGQMNPFFLYGGIMFLLTGLVI